jgi:cardiolipin synthase
MRLYPDGCEALKSLHQLIDLGQHRIDILMYWWESDDVGQDLAEHLARWAACQGRLVRVLIDTGGTLIHGEPSHASTPEVTRVINWLAQQPNVEVLRTRAALAHFDHRKLMLVDGKIAWTGGRNVTRVAFFKEQDLSFTVLGPLVERLNCLFESFWCEQGGRPCPSGSCTYCGAPPVEVPANAYARLIGTAPGRRDILNTVCAAISQARDHIYLENPCILDGRLICQLACARKRGIDVRVVLTLETKVNVIDRANRLTINHLLKAGVRVYHSCKPTHVKAMVVDGCWAYLGTGNFDALSLHRNRELGLAIGAGPVIQEVEQLFVEDFLPEKEVTCPVPTQPGDRLCEFLASFCL